MSRGIEIQIDVQEDPYVNGNRTQLESVIHNLLSNSRDAFGQSQVSTKRISIAARFLAPESVVRIDYRDNAGGIPEGVIDRIFEPFYTTKGGEGTGLGLPISKKILSDHGGSIHCNSTGGETLFAIILPGFRLNPGKEKAAALVKPAGVPPSITPQRF